jgi:hypothetical protein
MVYVFRYLLDSLDVAPCETTVWQEFEGRCSIYSQNILACQASESFCLDMWSLSDHAPFGIQNAASTERFWY